MSPVTKKKKNEWIEWIKAIFIAIIIAFILISFVFSTSVVECDSIDPTLFDGDRIVFNIFIYLIRKHDRDDIVIIQKLFKNYVISIIALSCETIELKNHTLYINGSEYEQMYIDEEAKTNTGNFGPYDIPEESYFVMGDNRAISKDSRNGLGLI